MATKNIVPNADTEGQLGTSTKGWGKIFLGGAAANIDVNNVSGTNTAGKSLTLISGASTGSGAGGSIIFQTAAAGGSGTSVNSHATVLTLDSAKLATFAGAVQLNSTLTVGVNDTGYDVKFFGATSGKSLLWDESADSLIVTGTTDLNGTMDVSGNATFSSNIGIGGGALQSYHANVTSALALDDQSSIFTRSNQLLIANNFYYGAGDAGLAIEDGKSSAIFYDRDQLRLYFAASANAGQASSLQEKLSVSETGLLTIKDDLVIKTGGTIGGASDPDLLTLSSGQVILDGNAGQGVLQLATSKAAGALNAGQSIGEINFRHNNAATAATVTGARIIGAAAEATTLNQDNHGAQLEFYTAANGNNETTPVKRLTIGSDGNVIFAGNIAVTGSNPKLTATNVFKLISNGGDIAFRARATSTPSGGVYYFGGANEDPFATPAVTIMASGNINAHTGNLVIGTPGKGIDFTAETPSEGGAGSVSSSLLDDYEEGTWVPTFGFSTNSVAYTNGPIGKYTKVGNKVSITASMQVSSVSSPAGNTSIEGLPFAVPNDSEADVASITIGIIRNLTTDQPNVRGYFNRNTNSITLSTHATNADHSAFQANTLAAGTLFYFSATYMTTT